MLRIQLQPGGQRFQILLSLHGLPVQSSQHCGFLLLFLFIALKIHIFTRIFIYLVKEYDINEWPIFPQRSKFSFLSDVSYLTKIHRKHIYHLSGRFCSMSCFSYLRSPKGLECAIASYFLCEFSYQSFREYLEGKVEGKDKIRASVHKIGSH